MRGVQSHSEKREQGEPGSRCALNLQGVELAQLARGQIVSTPGALAPAQALDVSLAWLATAPRAEGPVSVELLAATCERRARLAPIGAEELVPGERGFARIHVDGEPLPVLPGDRFIVRGFARSESSGATLGGGVVLDVAPPHRRRSDPQLLLELAELARREPPKRTSRCGSRARGSRACRASGCSPRPDLPATRSTRRSQRWSPRAG